MSSDVLLIDRPSTGVVLLTLNRPDALNALSLDLHAKLDAAVVECAADESVRCIVLTGAGRAFCSGNDIFELVEMTPDQLLLAEADREEYFWRFATCRKPTICAINGLAIGAGSIIATSADFRIGCPSTTIRYTDAAYGAIHNTWNLPQIVGLTKAKEYLFTSRQITADDALASGLLSALAPTEKVVDEALALAAEIAANTPSVQVIKESLHANIGLEWERQYRRENRMLKAMQKGANPTPGMFSKFLKKKRDVES